jgi:ATP-dependent DNA helicase RecG
MLEQELQRYLQREYPQENARCEWKEMKNLKNSFSGDERDDVISYVSAIANMEGGQLIIGVHDETLDIVGTDLSRFNLNAKSATWKLVEQCTNLPSEGLRIDEYTTEDTHKTVWIIHIPKHLPRRPVYAHKKAWQRIEDSLVEMTQDRLAAILEEPIFEAKDWSAEIVPNASLNDLDELAIAKARVMFKKVHASNIPAEEVNGWSDEELLSHSGVMRDGKLTRAAIILLGKPISVFKLRPAVAEVTWTLRDEQKEVVDYEHFTVPFILTVDKILGKIRNLTMRDLPGGTLFPETMKQYDDYTIREALHNALAHQDYTLQERIVFVENPGYLYYANGGSFIPGTLQKALATQGPQRHFRNECLCRAMVNFNMIDTVSRGIKKMFNEQRRRHFPMPDYEIDALNREVGVKIYGNTIDERYTKLLKENESLTLEDCILLDAVQKGHRISEEDAKSLFAKGLIEGSYPEIYLSETVSRSTGKLPEYVKNRGMKRQYYKDLVLALLEKSPKGVTRQDINDLLFDMLPKSIQKPSNYIGNLLYVMQCKEGAIYLKDGLWHKKDVKEIGKDAKEIEKDE